MATENLTAEDDDLTVIETPDENIPAPKPIEEDDDGDTLPADNANDEIDEDERLGDNEDDEPGDKTAKNREARKQRTERRKEAERRAKQEIDFLRSHTQTLEQRLAALEGSNHTSTQTAIEAQLAQAQREIEQAEFVLAKAIEAQNGEDAATAIRLRDEAVAKRGTLEGQKQSLARPTQPTIDPRVVNYAQAWTAANPWYDPNGSDEDSRITKAIDDGLAKEGYDPRTEDYWRELTARTNKRLGGEEIAPKRKVPPQGATREHAPTSTRNEVYVTPERKKAMMDANMWDDPVKRKRMLKAYQDYDRDNSAR